MAPCPFENLGRTLSLAFKSWLPKRLSLRLKHTQLSGLWGMNLPNLLPSLGPLGREVKLICLPSDSMGDRGHIKLIIYIYYDIYTAN